MSEENEAMEATESPVENSSAETISQLKTQINQINQKLVDANEEAGRRRKTNDRLKTELEGVRQEAAKPLENSNQEVVDQLNAKWEAKLNEERSKSQKIVQEKALSELKSSLFQENILKGGIEPLSLMAQQRLGFDEHGNVRIMSADNSKPLAGSGSDGYATISDLAKELAASDTGQHFTRDAGVSGGGKPPASSSGRLGNKSVTRAHFDTMTQSERSSFFKDGGKVVHG
tara:strand:+ start:321 stop:1010 length:690 start_codon:yes stop_codon:yes gene_type:complete